MQSKNHCSQYYPYAGKTTPCGGNVHELSILWEKAGELPVPLEPEGGTEVCDTHMQLFTELGTRQDYIYSIVKDVIIGEISPVPEEGQLSGKEQEK